MNSREIYKRVKIPWWIIIILGGYIVYMIFAYIQQWNFNPVKEIGLIISGIILNVVSIVLFFEMFFGRFILTIDDKFIIITFGSLSGRDIKIHVTQIKDVSIGKVDFRTYLKSAYQFDFTRQTVIIQTKSDRIYQIAIKNAQKIKEEIEKRMLTTNNIIQ